MLPYVVLLLAQAAPSSVFQACVGQASGVSAAMLNCGAHEIARWDRRLNIAYQQLLQRLPPAQGRALRFEQRGWLAHHLAETKRRADDPSDGSGAFLNSQSFELGDLSTRTVTLERRLAALR